MKVANYGYPPNTKYCSLRRLFVSSFHTQATLETPGYGLRPATQQYADQGRSRMTDAEWYRCLQVKQVIIQVVV